MNQDDQNQKVVGIEDVEDLDVVLDVNLSDEVEMMIFQELGEIDNVKEGSEVMKKYMEEDKD